MLYRTALGSVLRDNRASKGLTLKCIRDKSGLSKSHVSAVERGQKEISSETLERLCNTMRVGVSVVVLQAAERMMLDARIAREVTPRRQLVRAGLAERRTNGL